MFKDRKALTMSELFNSEHKHNQYGCDISSYEFCYNHDRHSLHHFPELLEVLKKGWKIHYNNFHKFFEFKKETKSKTEINYKELVRIVYNCFAQNHNLAIRINPNHQEIHIRQESIWKDEDFVNLRVRCNHEIRDFLGMNHGGHGINPVDVNKNKYYNSKQFRETQKDQNYDLFRGHDFEQTFHEVE